MWGLDTVTNVVSSGWSYFSRPNQQAEKNREFLEIKKEPFDPKNKTQVTFIKNKIKAYKFNYDAMIYDFKNSLWPTPAVCMLYSYLPSIFGYLAALIGAATELMLFNPLKLVPDFLARYPEHFKMLNEMVEIAEWMSKYGIDVTHNNLFVEVVDAISPLVPLSKIPFHRLSKKEVDKVNQAYLEVLFKPPHRIAYPKEDDAEITETADQKQKRQELDDASMMEAWAKNRLFGLDAGDAINKAQEVYRALPMKA